MIQPYVAKVNFPESLRNARQPNLMDIVIAQRPELAKAFGHKENEVLNPLPFKHDEQMLVLGEIENCPGFVAVANDQGRVFWGITERWFTKLAPEEVQRSSLGAEDESE